MVNWEEDARKLREYDSLRAERDKLRAEGVPGVIHAADRLFYDLAVKERNYARVQVENRDLELAAVRAQRDRAYAAERERTAELKAEILRLQAELSEARGAQRLYCIKAGIMDAMEASRDEPEGTVMQATDDLSVEYVLGGDRQWRRL